MNAGSYCEWLLRVYISKYREMHTSEYEKHALYNQTHSHIKICKINFFSMKNS